MLVAVAGCTSSGGQPTQPTTAVTHPAGPTGSSAPSGSASPSGSQDKPLTYQHITKKQGTKLESVIGGLPGVSSTAYYPDTREFEIYFSPKANKLDHTVVTSLVKQNLAKKGK